MNDPVSITPCKAPNGARALKITTTTATSFYLCLDKLPKKPEGTLLPPPMSPEELPKPTQELADKAARLFSPGEVFRMRVLSMLMAGPCLRSELAAACPLWGFSAGSLSVPLRGLRRRGYITSRKVSPNGLSVTRYRMTPKGKDYFADRVKHTQAFLREEAQHQA